MIMLTLIAARNISAAGGAEDDEAGRKLTIWCWDPAFNVYAMEEAAKVRVGNLMQCPWALTALKQCMAYVFLPVLCV